jgi:hypothetical protein
MFAVVYLDKNSLLSQVWCKPLYKLCNGGIDFLYIQPAAKKIKTHKVTAVEAMHPTLSKQNNRKNENVHLHTAWPKIQF